MGVLHYRGSTYRMERDMIDVTSLHRPDPAWTFTDPNGHLHQWHDADGIAKDYNPTTRYFVPTIVKVVDYPATDDYPEVFHYECKECRAVVEPGYRADEFSQKITGLAHYYIDDEPVSKDEFLSRAKAAGVPGVT